MPRPGTARGQWRVPRERRIRGPRVRGQDRAPEIRQSRPHGPPGWARIPWYCLFRFPNGRPPADGYWLSRFGFSAIPGRPRGSGSRPRAFCRALGIPQAGRRPSYGPASRQAEPYGPADRGTVGTGPGPSYPAPTGCTDNGLFPRRRSHRARGFSRGAGSATRPGRRSPGFTPGRRGSPARGGNLPHPRAGSSVPGSGHGILVFGIRAYRGLGPRVRQPRPPSRGHSPGPAAELFTASIRAGQVRWRTVGARGIPTLPGPGRPAHGHSPDGRLPAGVCSAIL